MSEKQFWACSLRYLYNLIEGISEAQRVPFEAARIAGTISLMWRLDKGKTLKLTDVFPFPWEKEKKSAKSKITPEMIAAARKFDLENPTFPFPVKNGP